MTDPDTPSSAAHPDAAAPSGADAPAASTGAAGDEARFASVAAATLAALPPQERPARPWRLVTGMAGLVVVLLAGLAAVPLLVAGLAPPPAGPAPAAFDAAAAITVVRGIDPTWAGLPLRDPYLIGQAAWVTAQRSGDGFVVTVYVGAGDCPAGCITSTTWTYEVTGPDQVRLVDRVEVR